jgi:hypothetical protein
MHTIHMIEIPPSTRCGTIPEICHFSFGRFIKIANMPVSMLNRIGEGGLPVEGLFSFERNTTLYYHIIELQV